MRFMAVLCVFLCGLLILACGDEPAEAPPSEVETAEHAVSALYSVSLGDVFSDFAHSAFLADTCVSNRCLGDGSYTIDVVSGSQAWNTIQSFVYDLRGASNPGSIEHELTLYVESLLKGRLPGVTAAHYVGFDAGGVPQEYVYVPFPDNVAPPQGIEQDGFLVDVDMYAVCDPGVDPGCRMCFFDDGWNEMHYWCPCKMNYVAGYHCPKGTCAGCIGGPPQHASVAWALGAYSLHDPRVTDPVPWSAMPPGSTF